MSSPRLRTRAKTGCDESGQAMVEFALVLPLVLLLLFGLLQFALVFNARQTVAYAADAAARTYAQTLDEQGANADAARAAAALRPGLVAPAASISYSIVDPSSAAERAVQGARTDVRERWERRCVSRRFGSCLASPVVNETITVTETGFTKTYSGGRLLWALKQGGAINFSYWATLTIVPVGQGC